MRRGRSGEIPAFGGYGTRRRPPRFIVIHHTTTPTAAATERVLENRGLSTHYEVDREGHIFQYLDPELHVAWHALWANADSIGIDVTHMSGDPWPDDQVQAVAGLVARLAARFDIPRVVAPDGVRYAGTRDIPAGVGLLRHRNIRPTACPEDFPMERLGDPAPLV